MVTKSKINFYSMFFKTLLALVVLVSSLVIGNILTKVDIISVLFFPNTTVQNALMLDWHEFDKFTPIALEDPASLGSEDQAWLEEMEQNGYIFYVPFNEQFYPVPDDSAHYITNVFYNDMYIELYVDNDRYQSEYSLLSDDMAMAEIYLWVLICALVLVAIASVLYCVLVGQNERGGEVTVLPVNHIFNDILTFIVGGFIVIIGMFIGSIWNDILYNYSTEEYLEAHYAVGNIVLYAGIIALCSLWLYYLNCISKRIKRKEFFAYTTLGFVVRYIKWIYNKIKTATKTITDTKTQSYIIMSAVAFVLVTIAFPFLFALIVGSISTYMLLTFFIVPIATAAVAYGAYRRLGELDSIKNGLAEIRSGNTYYRIPEVRSSMLMQMADDVNNLSEGLANSVETAMVSERMKTELITNVSHDLKTPLTSIVGYAELLSNVENMPDEAMDYTKVLQSKSAQLSLIISDLFDLAKSSSGNADITMEQLDLKKLIEQTLADLQDNIEASQLIIKTILPYEDVLIYADGNKLSRVFKNLVDNALKYSLRDSRVYIKLSVTDNVASAEVLNISAYEINFTEQEILQRFVRGDESRSTEGNGLGLSIAKSFTELCKGRFYLKIEGDMFKAVVEFFTAPPQKSNTEDNPDSY